MALDTGLPTAEAPPAPPAASPPPPEIPPEKAFARAMAMAPADRHARVVALAMQISVADAAADAKERTTRARSAEAKAALEAEAEACRREAATALEFAQKLEGAARTLNYHAFEALAVPAIAEAAASTEDAVRFSLSCAVPALRSSVPVSPRARLRSAGSSGSLSSPVRPASAGVVRSPMLSLAFGSPPKLMAMA